MANQSLERAYRKPFISRDDEGGNTCIDSLRMRSVKEKDSSVDSAGYLSSQAHLSIQDDDEGLTLKDTAQTGRKINE